MDKVRFLNRNRRNGLLAFFCVAMLLPLMLGQSSAGGCGATVTVPNPAPVDSDGDGFSDELEITSTPGTDPDDPTDNPNSVRDSDADGCSDYDEINFQLCDSDPYTPTSACQTTYYNADYHFGFDLPTTVELASEGDVGYLFSAIWVTEFPNNLMFVGMAVRDSGPLSLEEFVADFLQLHEDSGSTILDTYWFDLADGTAAHFTATSSPSPTVGLSDIISYEVNMIVDGFYYYLRTRISVDDYTDATDALMRGILDSLCID